MAYLLDLVYLLLLVAGSPWFVYSAIRKGKYREGWAAKFLGRVPARTGAEPCIWLHAVSVGEVNLLAPLLARLEQQHPEWACVISTTTKTGFDLAKKKYAPRTVFYCPLDFSWAVRVAVKRIRPRLLVAAVFARGWRKPARGWRWSTAGSATAACGATGGSGR